MHMCVCGVCVCVYVYVNSGIYTQKKERILNLKHTIQTLITDVSEPI